MYNIYIYKGEPQRFQFVFRAQMNSPAETLFFFNYMVRNEHIYFGTKLYFLCDVKWNEEFKHKNFFGSSLCKARVLTATTLLAQLWSLTLGL